MAEGIYVGGELIPLTGVGTLPISVLNWNDHGKEFRPGQGHNKQRLRAVEMIAWHWTGGEGDAMQVYRTLDKRGYGVPFVIDRNAIVQFADPAEVATATTGGVNAWTCGIEMVNYGFRRMRPSDWNLPRGNAIRVPKKGRDRLTYDTRIHGRKLRVAHFTPYQVTMAKALADALSKSLGVPRVTTPSRKEAGYFPGAAGFRGHVGHYELSENKRKSDPGPAFMKTLSAHFANSASGPT